MSRESDKKVPIAILFGPEACGKTCLLFRLLSWLREMGFHIEVDSLLFNFDSYDITQFILENWRAKSSKYFSDLEGFHWPILLDIISNKVILLQKYIINRDVCLLIDTIILIMSFLMNFTI